MKRKIEWRADEVEKYRDILHRIRAGETRKKIASALGVHRNTIRRLIERAEKWAAANERVSVTDCGEMRTVTASGTIKTLAELLKAANVDPTEWRCKSWSANKWDALTSADKNGNNRVQQLWQVKATLERIEAWQRTPISVIKPIPRKKSEGTERELRRAVIIPDSQNGLIRRRNKFEPTHDRKAWDLCVQAVSRIEPEVVVLLGDMLDLPTLSRFSSGPELGDLIQPTLAELYWQLSQLRMACLSSKIVWIEGNHEARLRKSLIDSVKDAARIHVANETDGTPAMSIQKLMALDSLDIEYVSPYGAEWWLFDKVRVHHGDLARKGGGATVAATLRSAACSEIFGHVHRLELAGKTISDSNGQRYVWAMSPGTIARIDRPVVPGSTPRTDWQQGLGIVTMTPPTAKTDSMISMEAIPIQFGRCVVDGMILHGVDRSDEIREATGWSWF